MSFSASFQTTSFPLFDMRLNHESSVEEVCTWLETLNMPRVLDLQAYFIAHGVTGEALFGTAGLLLSVQHHHHLHLIGSTNASLLLFTRRPGWVSDAHRHLVDRPALSD